MKKGGDSKAALAPVMRMSPYVKAIWMENGSVTVLVDDNIETPELSKKLNRLMDKASDGIKFNRKKSLTLWWELVRHAEPKTLELLNDIKIVYDPSDYVKLFKGMIGSGSIYGSNQKADMVFEKAKKHLEKSEHILMDRITHEIFHAMTESAQALLLYMGRYAATPEDVLKCLGDERYVINQKYQMSYRQIVEEIGRIQGGCVEEFTPKEAGIFMTHARNFIFEMEDMIVRLERDKSEMMMHDAYNFCMRQCETALKEHMSMLPMQDTEKMGEFKRHYIDTGRMDPLHYITFKALHDFNHADKKAKLMLMSDRTLDRARVKSLSLAMQDVTRI